MSSMEQTASMARRARTERRLRLAVYGVLAENAGSGAGAFPVLLSALLERGHRVEFFGNPAYVRPRSLERFSGYRFHPLHVEAADRLWYRTERFVFARAVVAQLGHAAYARAAIQHVEREHEREPYDLIFATDVQPLWPSRLPVIAWPQSPPHSEAAALRTPALARELLKISGPGNYAAIQAFYAYRLVTAQLGLRASDIYLCGSRWARDEWERFGAAPERLLPFPYPIDVRPFSRVPPLAERSATTFLWLGRSSPRKRLDLFVEGFIELRKRHPEVRARVIGNVAAHPFGRAVLARHGAAPGLSVEPAIARDAVPELFEQVDVLVQPSQNENFGFSVAEALAAGRAVVAGPTNGTLEYAGAAGFGFSEYSASAVADAMERAMLAIAADGPAVSRSAREAARQFEVDAVTERFVAECERLVQRRAVTGVTRCRERMTTLLVHRQASS
jgi:glycosyltransferase involved in cell wall biosynthesis